MEKFIIVIGGYTYMKHQKSSTYKNVDYLACVFSHETVSGKEYDALNWQRLNG